MGLDTVELIYIIEEHLKIPIPDQQAEKMDTIRQIVTYIVKLSNAGTERKAKIKQEILLLVSNHSGISLKNLRLEMSITNDLGLG